MKKGKPRKIRAGQQQKTPGYESKMNPRPQVEKTQKPYGKFAGKVVLITGADSGIGRATAVAFAQEGADIVVIYLKEHADAKETKRLIEEKGQDCLLIAGDVGDEAFCKKAMQKTLKTFGKLNVLINNAAEQHPQKKIEDITRRQLEKTFRTNIFSMFYMVKASIKALEKSQGVIINTTSVTAYRGSEHLLDYSATKGAIVAFTRSLALALADKKIRVNGVAPGPIWTPLIPSTFPRDKVKKFGSDVPLKRAGEPSEVAPCYVFLASDDASYITGQVMHPNGGEIVNT